MSHVTRMNESCHTYKWVMSHVWMSHVTLMNAQLPDLHLRETLLEQVCLDITHSYARHDSFICVSWLIHLCVVTHVIWLIHKCDMTHSYLRDTTLEETPHHVWIWLIVMYKYVLWLIHVTRPVTWHDSFYVTWLIHVARILHVTWLDHVTKDMRVPYLILVTRRIWLARMIIKYVYTHVCMYVNIHTCIYTCLRAFDSDTNTCMYIYTTILI